MSATMKERFAKRRERQKKWKCEMEALLPEQRLKYINLNEQPTEFEIQAFLFSELQRLGYQVRGELSTKCKSCRFDLLVSKDGVILRIIEVKKHRNAHSAASSFFGDCGKVKRAWRSQVNRYSMFGITVDIVGAMSNAREYIAKIEKIGFLVQ